MLILRAAYQAGSIALAGFGLDSLIEIGASLVVVWPLRGGGKDHERRALRLIGVAFLSLALYVLVQSLRALLHQTTAATSPFGMIWLSATVLVMVLLAWGKQRTGIALANPVLITEARVTIVDAMLAAAVLVGIAMNAQLGW